MDTLSVGLEGLLTRYVFLGPYPQFFTTLRVENGGPLFFKAHLKRLSMGLELAVRSEFEDCLSQLLLPLIKERGKGSLRLRVLVDQKKKEVGLTFRPAPAWGGQIQCGVYTEKLDFYPSWVKKWPYHQRTNFLISNSETDEALVFDGPNLLSGLISNVFLIQKERVLTPKLQKGVLDGILRRLVVDWLRASGQIIEECEKLTLRDIVSSDSLFLTNSVRGVRFVRKFINEDCESVDYEQTPFEDKLVHWSQTLYEEEARGQMPSM